MNTCDTCKHWTPCELLGDCSSPKFIRGYSTKLSDVQPDGVAVEDDEGWAFQTGPKFGCVHWQESP